MRFPVVSFMLFGCLLSSCAEAPEVEVRKQEILGGTAAAVGEYPTVVAILNRGLCTGTLIAPDLVLTAAHCISASLMGLSSQAQVTAQTQILLDSNTAFGGSGRRIQAAETMPNAAFSAMATGDNDVGLIRLATPVTDRLPTPINRINADAPVGIKVTQVGFGATQVGGQGAGSLFALKDKATTSCSEFGGLLDANLICFSQSDGTGKCQGDSGGPSFATINGVTRVVGVTSFGDQSCAQFGADTRIDSELEFLYNIAPELQCQADGACNEDCGNQGLPIDDDCMLCTSDDECEQDQICADNGQCVAAPFTPGGAGADCAGDQECDSEICASSPQGGICTKICVSDDQCLDRFSCIVASASTTKVCWPASSSDTSGCSVGSGKESGGGSGKGLAGLFLLGCALILGRRRRA